VYRHFYAYIIDFYWINCKMINNLSVGIKFVITCRYYGNFLFEGKYSFMSEESPQIIPHANWNYAWYSVCSSSLLGVNVRGLVAKHVN
jgi:hypothetical protein